MGVAVLAVAAAVHVVELVVGVRIAEVAHGLVQELHLLEAALDVLRCGDVDDLRQMLRFVVILGDVIDGRGLIDAQETAVHAALLQHVEMHGGLAGVEDAAGERHRINAVGTEIFRVEEEHHGEIAARRGAADENVGEAAVGEVLHVCDRSGGVLDEFGILRIRIEAVVDGSGGDAVARQLLQRLRMAGIAAAGDAAAVDVDEQRGIFDALRHAEADL